MEPPTQSVRTAAELKAAGVSKPHRDRPSNSWVHEYRGIYVPDGDFSFTTSALAAVRSAGEYAAVSHESAAQLHGLQGADGLPGLWSPRPGIQLTAPRDYSLKKIKGRKVLRSDLPDHDLVAIDGIRTTSILRTCVDVLLSLPLKPALSIVESALHLGKLDVTEIDEVRERLHDRHGAIKARKHLKRLRVGTESPLETVSRLELEDHGFTDLAIQVPVRGWRADFLIGSNGRRLLVGEADGMEIHRTRRARHDDRRREEGLRDLGYEFVSWTWSEIVYDPDLVMSRVRRRLDAIDARFASP